jgi:hypothetical protein
MVFLINLKCRQCPFSELKRPNLLSLLAPTAKYYMVHPRISGLDVPIRALLENDYRSAFGPEDIPNLAAAFDAASKLGLVDRKDPMTMTVAKLIIEPAKNGERNPKKLFEDALKLLGKWAPG